MTTPSQDLKPICYMVMPFRTKKVDEPRPPGAPVEIDFDALWNRAYMPAIEQLGYLPMRADFDPNTAIVKAMLERIAFADLVIADMTIGNGNCYYELGIRHVAKQTHCIVVSADWVRPLFDIAQFASVRFPLKNGAIPQDEADAIRDVLVSSIPNIKESINPYWALLGDSGEVAARKGTFRDFAERLSAFQAKVKGIRAQPAGAERLARLEEIIGALPVAALEIPEVAFDLIMLTRDLAGWKRTIALIETLPAAVRKSAWVQEQYCLAVSGAGDPATAIGLLEELIARMGDTPERSGLLGGRYRRLWSAARDARKAAGATQSSVDERRYLANAIKAYARGMDLDFNEYYCSCNVPALLRERRGPGDLEQAALVEHFVVAACERARARGSTDEWLRPTLLGAAFRTGNVKHASSIADDIESEGAATWKLETTLSTLALAISQTEDPDKRSGLQGVYDRLVSLVPPSTL